MTLDTHGASQVTKGRPVAEARPRWHPSMLGPGGPDLGHDEPFAIAALAETAEVLIENLDAPLAAQAALPIGLESIRTDVPSCPGVALANELQAVTARRDAGELGVAEPEPTAIAVDEYAKAVLYNGLGHYQAARVAAHRACRRDDFPLLEGALAELVEASVRSGFPDEARTASARLQARAEATGTDWAKGLAACSQALLVDDKPAEESYREAIKRLDCTAARVALARAQLLYGEWLRRGGRRVDAREQLSEARQTFINTGLSGFAERAYRELLATGETVRKRTDETRFDLTPQEEQIAHLAASGATNPEIGERLFISPRTVEWHLRKVFTKVGVRSRRELRGTLPCIQAATR